MFLSPGFQKTNDFRPDFRPVVKQSSVLVASLLLVAMPGAPFVASLLLVLRPGASSSFLFLVAMPGAPSLSKVYFGAGKSVESLPSCWICWLLADKSPCKYRFWPTLVFPSHRTKVLWRLQATLEAAFDAWATGKGSKKLLGAPGIATRSKDTTSSNKKLIETRNS